MIRDRNEKCPVEEVNRIAKVIKEKYGYVVPDGNLMNEFASFDQRMTNEKLKKKFERYI